MLENQQIAVRGFAPFRGAANKQLSLVMLASASILNAPQPTYFQSIALTPLLM